MEQHSHNLKFRRQRKFLMVLPLLVLPFITLMFWALGGGKANDHDIHSRPKQGLNTSLPDPHLKEDEELDKLSYYDRAASDSAKFKTLMKKNPFYNRTANATEPEYAFESFLENELKFKANEGSQRKIEPPSYPIQSPSEAKVHRKLEQLNAVLRQTSTLPEEKSYKPTGHSSPAHEAIHGPDMQQLENMMEEMSQSGGVDTELEQLNSMLEKVLDIQHPDRVQERLRELSERRNDEVHAVSLKNSTRLISSLDGDSFAVLQDHEGLHNKQTNGFYSFSEVAQSNMTANAIEAVVHETQTLTSGSTLKLRLVNDIYINGILIPKDNFIFGIVSLNGERLHVKITTVLYDNSLFPVTLTVHDLDGLNGIYIPGAITREVTKQSTDRAVQSFGLTTFDPTFGEQAAVAGVDAAQNLLSKKVKLVKVMVKAGYKVLLLDDKQRHTYNQ